MTDELIKNLIDKSEKHWTFSSTFKEINDKVKHVVTEYYKPYIKFEKNMDNMNNTITKLTDYIYIKDDIPPKGSYVRILSKKYFYDMVLHAGGFVVGQKKNTLTLFNNGNFIKFNRTKDDKKVFMRLSDDDKFRAFLNEVGNELL